MEFNYQMWATHDASLCLDRSFCLPLGSQSVWSSLGPLDTRKQVVMGVAGMDSAGMFHDRVIGANSAVSGTVALLAAAHTLATVDPAQLAGLQHQLVFAFFQGEDWGYIGSRAFLNDLQNFTCEKPTADGAACEQPYRQSLAFTNMSLTRVAALLEAKQVGFPGGALHVHTERPQNPSTANVVRALMQAAREEVREAIHFIKQCRHKLWWWTVV